MKYKTAIIILLLIAIIYSYNIASSFNSNNTLIYDGRKNTFTYYNLEQGDLFDEFKDLIPGDVREQTINIKGTNIDKDTTLYLELNTEINEELLNYINVTVYKDDEQLEKYNDKIKIANFKNDDSFTLKIKVEVPVEVDNAIEDLEVLLKWTFLIEQKEKTNDQNSKPIKVPYTYDNGHIITNIITVIISLIGIIMLILKKKKLKEN